jgi:putative membrane protein
MDFASLIRGTVSSLLFAAVGFIVFVVGFYSFDKLTPYHLWTELTEHRNVAVAIVVGAVSIGISIIIAAAIHG